MKMQLTQLLMAGFVLMHISCSSADNSDLENTVNEMKENQNNILEQIASIAELQENQKVILDKIKTFDKSIANLTLANKNRPADNKKKQPPKADPNKVYDIEIGDSFALGPDDAKVTIIEWMDFQ